MTLFDTTNDLFTIVLPNCHTSTVPVIDQPPPLTARRKWGEVADRFEKLLREHNIGYVDVDEAKRALFKANRLATFHFVCYAKHGSNWLVMARQGAQNDQEVIDDMRRWEDIFGDGFRAVFVWLNSKNEFRYAALSGGDRPSLEDLT